MNSPTEVKARATKLRDVLGAMGHQLKHSESLEVISKIEGYPNWNTYTADIANKQKITGSYLDDKNNKATTASADSMTTPQKSKVRYCSFCGNSEHEVLKLIAGPEVYICDLCTDLCVGILLLEVKKEVYPVELKNMRNLQSLIRKAQFESLLRKGHDNEN